MTKKTHLIQAASERRGITRLCHFTPSRNLGHIAKDPEGILASWHLDADDRAVFNPTDLKRLDGYPDHICCSIQYPNAWYFKKARENEPLFPDWVVLLIEAHYLWRTDAKFCPRNAAAQSGRLIDEGIQAFEALFAETVEGVRTYARGPRHPASFPTDEQAEVLIPDRIQRRDIIGIVVCDDAQARREVAALKLLGQAPPPIVVIPEFFNPNGLSSLLRDGRVPHEREYQGATP